MLAGAFLDAMGGDLLENNSTDLGGGIYNSGGTIVLDGCGLSDNHALNNGGGLYLAGGSTTTLKNLTVSENSAQA